MKRSRSPDVESRLNGGSLPPLATKRQNTVSGAPDASLSSDCEHGDISTSPGETSRATGTRTRGGDPLISIWPGRSMPWLRSGRSFAHPLVPESETIQVRPLSELELNTLPEADQTDGTASSESTISEAWNASSLAAPSPALGRFRVRDTFTGSRLHAPIRGSSSQSSNEENNDPESTPCPSLASAASSPGFELLGDTSLHSARDKWQPEKWPLEVIFSLLSTIPQDLRFPAVSLGINGGEGCGREDRCLADTCLNALSSRFCNAGNCPFMGECGNSRRESSVLEICRNVRTGMRGVVTRGAISAWEVIGEYFGHLQYFGTPCRSGPANEGYRLRLKTKTTGIKHVRIDALHAGSKLRLLSYSCNPCARFHVMQTGKN
ncbi:hypothetical protein F442_02755 [Phytophthora nicotianae P10297]|uniref:SET domain-containing protein n=1 Tax=Phytophthora nicotianae P10297 TaxID=1317064 RepID=W2ZYV9_PHYNI|nr:hypothetical protein F442_02755 [Phytophthora nicotianae P10297]